MKKIFPILILVLLTTMLNFSPARATGFLNPTDDTYTDLNEPALNTNGAPLVADYSYLPDYVITRRVNLRFDLSAMTTDALPGSVLRLHVLVGPFNTIGNLALWSMGDDWNGADPGIGSETTLTWDNAPAPIAKLDTKPAGADGTDIEFSSDALQSYINSQRSDNGGDNVASFMVQWDSLTTHGFIDVTYFENRENSGGSGMPPELILYTPTAVDLINYNSTPQNRDIQVSWETVNEIDLIGFNIYRATEIDGQRIQLNPDLIPAYAIGQQKGHSYTFADSAVQAGVHYYYWLQLVDTSSKYSVFGPMQATGQHVQYFPFAKR